MQAIVTGILVGGIYGIVSMGLSLIFGVMRIINFAHGELVMLGMFAAYFTATLAGLDPFISILLVIPIMLILGFVIQKFFIQSLIEEDHTSQLLVTLALSLILQNLMMMLLGPNSRTLHSNYTNTYLNWGIVDVNLAQLIAFLISIVVSVVMAWILLKTDIGKSLRATVDDREMAELVGINTERLYLIAFGISTVLAGIGGSILVTYYPVSPTVGSQFIVIAFVAVVLGGMGNVLGAFAAGIIIGIIQQLTAAYWDVGMQDIVVFFLFIILLLYKPNGIFGSKEGGYV
jgi:branched-chain amino acid transport system permease protein